MGVWGGVFLIKRKRDGRKQERGWLEHLPPSHKELRGCLLCLGERWELGTQTSPALSLAPSEPGGGTWIFPSPAPRYSHACKDAQRQPEEGTAWVHPPIPQHPRDGAHWVSLVSEAKGDMFALGETPTRGLQPSSHSSALPHRSTRFPLHACDASHRHTHPLARPRAPSHTYTLPRTPPHACAPSHTRSLPRAHFPSSLSLPFLWQPLQGTQPLSDWK